MPALRKALLDVLHFSGTAHLLKPWLGGVGVIFMLHHVRPGGGLEEGFAPNSGLEVTPEFLSEVIGMVKAQGYALVSLEEAAAELLKPAGVQRPFAVFTSDDGYRDNMEHAWPVFRAHDCPFSIFVAPAIADGVCELWWRGLEAVVACVPEVSASIDGVEVSGHARTDAEKDDMFWRLYWPVRNLDEHRQRTWVRAFCSAHGVDLDAMCAAEAMNWDELREIAADPLCSIGAHTVHHRALKKLSSVEAITEAVQSRERIRAELGRSPQTFAYPYGDETSAGPRDFDLIREAGFKAAVTTRKGLIFPAHRDHLTALPRLSLNGAYQHRRYAEVLLTGTPFALANRQRVKVA